MMAELNKELNVTTTENGDTALLSTGSKNLDFFSLAGAMRYSHQDLIPLFIEAFYEDKAMSLKNLFYLRDIRGGLGERSSFKQLLLTLASLDTNILIKIIPFISKYGRFDDLLPLLDTNASKAAIDLLEKQFKADLTNYKDNPNTISLVAKWLPSINASNPKTISYAKQLATSFGMDYKTYRKNLAALRKTLNIVENNLRTKDYTFEYASLPSYASNRYTNTFLRNDNARFNAYLEAVKKGEKKMNVDTLYPYDIITPFYNDHNLSNDSIDALNLRWQSSKRNTLNKKSIVVRDGSGSMYSNDNFPIRVATSLAILFSEQLTGDFKNKFITFSERPRLITLPDEASIYNKLLITEKYDEASNTNIAKVYELIFNIESKSTFNKEDMIDQLIIISDMEFDECVEGVSTYDTFKEKFEKANLTFPQIIFWNVDARSTHIAAKGDNVITVSGASKNIIDNLINNDVPDPYAFMFQVLSKYDEVVKTI